MKTKSTKKKSVYDKKKPVLLIKLGDKKRGWIPDQSHADSLAKMCKEMGLTDRFNILLYHWGIEVSLVESDNITLAEYGLMVIDEKKFKKLVSSYKKISTNNTPASIKKMHDEIIKEKS